MQNDAQARAGSPLRKYLYGAIGLLALAVVAAVWNHRSAKTDGPSGSTPPLVSVIVPNRGDLAASVTVTGQISAVNDMPIGVDGNAGRIADVMVEPGDFVRKGQVLARLNPITAQSQVDSAQASLEELRSSAAVAQAEWARAQRARDAFSVEEAERRRVAAANAEARVKAAEAQLASARDQFERTTVIAPTDGIVLTRTAEVGQIAVPGGNALFRLARGGAIEMRAQVAEQDMPRLKVGQQATVRLDGVGQTWTGKVWQLGAIIDPATRQGSVRISLPSSDRNLRPGAFARAEVGTGTAQGMVLPQTAVLNDDQGSYVLVVGAGDKVERRGVQIAGPHQDGLLISGGLSGNERVVAIAGAFLRIGEQVAIAHPTGNGDKPEEAVVAGSKQKAGLTQAVR
jgi:RND family efflux transporter MFP subunit